MVACRVGRDRRQAKALELERDSGLTARFQLDLGQPLLGVKMANGDLTLIRDASLSRSVVLV